MDLDTQNNYLVTGGAGFIGSNIVKELLQTKQKVRVLDNFATGKRENLFEFKNNPDFELIEGDLRSFHVVRTAVKDMDYVLHQGALPSVPRSIHDPLTTNDVNILGTLNILEAAKEFGVKRVVYASSSSIYGENESLPKTEDMPVNPLSPYAMLQPISWQVKEDSGNYIFLAKQFLGFDNTGRELSSRSPFYFILLAIFLRIFGEENFLQFVMYFQYLLIFVCGLLIYKIFDKIIENKYFFGIYWSYLFV
jgi:hypothetical protein